MSVPSARASRMTDADSSSGGERDGGLISLELPEARIGT
jgi:hypothetical protein